MKAIIQMIIDTTADFVKAAFNLVMLLIMIPIGFTLLRIVFLSWIFECGGIKEAQDKVKDFLDTADNLKDWSYRDKNIMYNFMTGDMF